MTAIVQSGAAPVNATRFRAAHQAEWERLEALVTRVEKRSIKALGDDDLLALPQLYRAALSSLSLARATSLDKALIGYLEQLCTRAYFQLYGPPTSPARAIGHFFRRGWPAAVQALWRETLAAFVLLAVGVVAGYLIVRVDATWFYAIMPESLAGGRDPTASAARLRETIYTKKQDMLGTFAAALFTNNAQIAIFSFALGFAFAVPTALLLVYNGLMLGALHAVFAGKGLGVGFAGWIAIHGTTELFAIALAGGAGFRIGTAIAFPAAVADGFGDRGGAAGSGGDGRRGGDAGGRRAVGRDRTADGDGRRATLWDRHRHAAGLAAVFLPAAGNARCGCPGVGARGAPRTLRRSFVTPEGVNLQLELGAGGARAGAFVLDAVMMLVLLIAMTVAIGYSLAPRSRGDAQAILWLLGFFTLRNGWFALFEMGGRGATPGKRLLGLRVVARDGARLTGGAVIARNAMREIEVFLPLSFLGFQTAQGAADAFLVIFALLWSGIFLFFPLFNRDRLRLGDLVAGTWVVRSGRRKLGHDLGVAERQRRVFPAAALDLYGIYELQTLEEVLRSGREEAVATVAATIRRKADLVWDGDDRGFLEDYYAALCVRLERAMLLGQRREDKHGSFRNRGRLSLLRNGSAGMEDERIWAFEESLWTADAEGYEDKVDDGVVMVLPTEPYVLCGADAKAAVKNTPRWAEVDLSQRTVSRPQEGLIVVAYHAAVSRKSETYRAWCTSTYRRLSHEHWTVVQHQQTPASGS